MCATNVEPATSTQVLRRPRTSSGRTSKIVRDGLYLVLPVPFRSVEGELLLEEQAAAALEHWAANFTRVIVAAPTIPETLVSSLIGFEWRAVRELAAADRIITQPLPWAYTAAAFFKQVTGIRRQMGQTIKQAEHLQFSIGGLVGDWAAVAAMEAIRLKRRYVIQTGLVEHEHIRRTARRTSGARRIALAVEAPLMERYHRHIITHCALGLWHGEESFRAYGPWAAQSHLVREKVPGAGEGRSPGHDAVADSTASDFEEQSDLIRRFAS